MLFLPTTARPLPQISPLGTATAAEVASAPTTSQEGAFGAFSISRGNLQTKWVALPQWKALQLARHPVALPVSNCMADPAIVAASRVKVGGMGLYWSTSWCVVGKESALSSSGGMSETKWVALQLARHPVAVPISNRMADAVIVAASRVKVDGGL